LLQMNGVALTTALVAHRAFELSLIPDEANTRQRRSEASTKRSLFRNSRDTKMLQSCDSRLPLTNSDENSVLERERARSNSPAFGGVQSPSRPSCNAAATNASSEQQRLVRPSSKLSRHDTLA
uniref:Pecanex-like protein n=1 Tax=Anisakis simplex TaxID=6269 RepID=A0A0M3J5R4_ANISI